MDICRAFDIFEIIALTILIMILFYGIRAIVLDIKNTTKENKPRTIWQWIICFIPSLLGLPIGYLIGTAYLYIKSMFC